MLGGAVVIFVVVMALLLLSFTRWRGALALSPRAWLLWAGLVFPTLTLAALYLYSLGIIGGPRLAGHAAGAHRIEVSARQWEWRIRYPDAGGAESVDVLYLPAGLPVELRLRSDDVIHSFWVPRLAGKMDAMPGHENVLHLLAPQPGEYRGQCSEFCGAGHAGMGLLVRVAPPSEYRALLAALPPPPHGDRK